MRSLLLFTLLTSGSAAQKVINWDVEKRPAPKNAARKTKRASITEALGNAENLYYANVSVGTPGQLLQLQLDTGSSDVWMTATGDEFCQQEEGGCTGGTFDRSRSSSYRLVDENGFRIQYVDETGSRGDYFTDNIAIGGVTLNAQQMGLATETTIGTGIIGTGFALNEAVCAQSQGQCRTYPSIIQTMVNQSKINSQAYSLWLNDAQSNTGSILFGGVDTDKYMGKLTTLPILRDAQSEEFTSFTVAWTGFSIGTPKGEQTNFVPSNFAQPAILDSGTSTLLFPDDLAQQLFNQFGAQYSSRLQAWVAPCYLRNANATLDFAFGGPGGPTIRVAVEEFLLDLTPPGAPQFKFDNGDVACLLGFEAAQDRPILLGDTFLRSAYVVYDIDNREISIAQTIFNAGSSNVQEIRSGPRGVPNVASTASAASVLNTATGIATIGIAATNVAGNAGSGSVGTDGPPPLAQWTTAPASFSGTAGPSQGAAPGVRVVGSSEGLVLVGIVSLLAVLGSSLVCL